MSRNSVVEREPERERIQTPPAAPAAPEVVPLREVLRQIQRDSHTAPAQYLDETEVQYGGE